jgi:hypothetical protein
LKPKQPLQLHQQAVSAPVPVPADYQLINQQHIQKQLPSSTQQHQVDKIIHPAERHNLLEKISEHFGFN